eukprot:CAMPEP_0119035986 /NCGR_PEP_ID=MMETSP1177-20130426/3313_1 /TAXON_ID=2985 /ORGANISM="Ochromonas sp, Strain CCMP1899" /LENGTH=262 /DNA_ID=CAMNT_0006995003 /DNA_START=282 /DNA_END=1070 /DNA_ORIENTATION=+
MEVFNDADVNHAAPSSSSGVLMEVASDEGIMNNTSNITPYPYLQTTKSESNGNSIPTMLPPVSVVKNLKKKRISDMERVQKILEVLSMKSVQPEKIASGRYKKQKILNDGRVLILEYAKELSSAILEEASLLARHRGVNEMSVKDAKLILGKKFGIDGSGYIPREKRVSASKEGAVDEEEEVIDGDLLESNDVDIAENDEVKDDKDVDILSSEEKHENLQIVSTVGDGNSISNEIENKESSDLNIEDTEPAVHRGGKGLMLS